MISIICVYNDKQVLYTHLIKSLNDQTVGFDFIKLDNTTQFFKSASHALNYGGKKAKSEYIMFVHQDVELPLNSWLEDTEKWLNSLNDLGIAGVAGMSKIGKSNKERGRNIIKHGEPAEIWSWGNYIQEPEPVQTLDECLAIIPKKVFDVLQFDENACSRWDLYSVDYCLSVKKLGLKAYVIPMTIYHKSTGYRSKNYYQTIGCLASKHKNDVKYIYTTCGDWNTSYPIIIQKVWKYIAAVPGYLIRKIKKYR